MLAKLPDDEQADGSSDATTDINQLGLFDDESWKAYWKGMPEFEQKDLLPRYEVKVNFATLEDIAEFSRKVGYVDDKGKPTITADTRSVWFPEQEAARMTGFWRYADATLRAV